MVQDTYKRITFSGSATLGGNNSRVTVADSASMRVAAQAAACFRFKIPQQVPGSYHTLIDKITPGGGWPGFMVLFNAISDRLEVYADGGGVTLTIINLLKYGEIVHLVVNFNNTTGNIEAYYNGVFVGSAAYASLTATAAITRIGIRSDDATGGMRGDMYEAQLYNRYLTEAEIAWNYRHPNNPKRRGCVLNLVQNTIDIPAAGAWKDVSPQTGNNGTITNATTSKYPAIRAGANALFFPTVAASDKVDCGNGASLNPALTGLISGDFWIKTVKGKSGGFVIADKWGANQGWSFIWDVGSKTIYLYSDVGNAILTVPIDDFIDGTWKHVVFTHTAGAATGEIYVNGVNKTNTRTIRALTNSATNLIVANNNASTYASVGGYTAAARIYNRILSAAEVLYNFQHPNNAIKRGRVLDLSPESLYGTRWYDLSGNANHGTITGAIAKNIGLLTGR